MNQVKVAGIQVPSQPKRWILVALIFLSAGISACGGKKDSKPGQTLVSVNGEEITVTQLNDELQRANVQSAQQEAATAQILESLIDRQLVVNEAIKEKLDRDPQILRSIERAKALLIAQAYIQKKLGPPVRPSREEVDAYFAQNPDFFSNRKVFEMRQLVLASKDVSAELKAAIDAAKSLDESATWMEQHKVAFTRAQLVRSSADLPPQLSARLLSMPKGQLFMIKEGDRSLLVTITDIKDAPVALTQATPQIEQLLANKKNKDAAEAEVARLRASAKIEYLNGRKAPVKAEAGGESLVSAATASASAVSATKPNTDEQNARGVAGLK